MADGRKRGGLKLTAVPIDSVAPHPDNHRRGDVAAIKRLIQAHGLYRPIVVQASTRLILAGNHTWKAAKELGHRTIDIVTLDVDDQKAKEILVADNRASDLAHWDDEGLAELLKELESQGRLEQAGYDETALAKLLASLEVPDFTAADEGQQSRLDERARTKCPKCGHEFFAS